MQGYLFVTFAIKMHIIAYMFDDLIIMIYPLSELRSAQ